MTSQTAVYSGVYKVIIFVHQSRRQLHIMQLYGKKHVTLTQPAIQYENENRLFGMAAMHAGFT